MKKILVLTVVLFCAVSAFAAKWALCDAGAPIAFQISTESTSDEQVASKYGTLMEVAYRRYLIAGLYAEGGLDWGTFTLPEGNKKLTSLMPFAGIGYDLHLVDVLKVYAHADLCTDTLIYDKTGSESITFKTGAGFGFIMSDKMEAVVGCDGTFGFAKKNGVSYVNYRIIPVIGGMLVF